MALKWIAWVYEGGKKSDKMKRKPTAMTSKTTRGKNELHVKYRSGSLTSRNAISTLSVFQLLIMKYLVSISLRCLLSEVFV